MSHRLVWGLLLVLVLSLLACNMGLTPTQTLVATPAPRSATLSELSREVLAREKTEADWQTAAEGQRLREGGGVKTGDEARARLDISDGTLLRLAANSEFVLNELAPGATDPITRIGLEAGKLWVGVAKALGVGTFEVETPEGVATVRGSWMSASYTPGSGQFIVSCLEGQCRLTSVSGSFTDLLPGQQSEIPAAGQDPTPAQPIDAAQLRDWQQNVPEAQLIIVTITPAASATEIPTLIPPTPTVPATSGGGQTACDHPYFPLRPGAKWNYSTDVGSGALAWEVTGVEGDANRATAKVIWDNGASQGAYVWQCQADGLASLEFAVPTLSAMIDNAQANEQTGVFLPPAARLAPGYAWQYAFQLSFTPKDATLPVKITHAAKLTVTGKGSRVIGGQTFETIELSESATTDYEPAAPGHVESALTFTFALGVGLVEQTSTSATTGRYTLQLADFTIP